MVVDELAFSFDRTDVKYSLYDLDGQGGIIHEPKVIDDADYAIVDTPGYISDKGVHREVESEGSCRQILGPTDRNRI